MECNCNENCKKPIENFDLAKTMWNQIRHIVITLNCELIGMQTSHDFASNSINNSDAIKSNVSRFELTSRVPKAEPDVKLRMFLIL